MMNITNDFMDLCKSRQIDRIALCIAFTRRFITEFIITKATDVNSISYLYYQCSKILLPSACCDYRVLFVTRLLNQTNS